MSGISTMKKVLCALLLYVAVTTSAAAQTWNAIVVTTCGTPPYTYPKGTRQPVVQDITGTLCTPAGGGGGGGAVTIADGSDVAEGATTDAAATVGSTGSVSAKLRLITTLLNSVLTGVNSPIPAGTQLIGKVGIDQTTPGTTNLVALGANQSVNEAQINGVTPLMGNGVSGTGSQRVNIASDNSPITTTTAAADPCRGNVATIKPFSITTNTTTNIVTGTSAKKLYVCYLYMQTAAANNVAVISGTTGATCGSNTAALVGGTTAANGLNNAANNGQAMGNGGFSVLQVQTNNDDICIITSAATPLAGVIKYVVQ